MTSGPRRTVARGRGDRRRRLYQLTPLFGTWVAVSPGSVPGLTQSGDDEPAMQIHS